MIDTQRRIVSRGRRTRSLLIAAFVLLVVSAAGAADRVVLGEYFTNVY